MLLGFFFRTRGNRGESRQIFDGILSGKFNHENFSGQLFADSQTKWLFVLIAEGILGFSVQNIIATNAKWYCVVIVSTCAYQSNCRSQFSFPFFLFCSKFNSFQKKKQSLGICLAFKMFFPFALSTLKRPFQLTLGYTIFICCFTTKRSLLKLNAYSNDQQ